MLHHVNVDDADDEGVDDVNVDDGSCGSSWSTTGSDHSHTLSAATAATGCWDLYQFVSIKMSLESLQCYDFANVMSIVSKSYITVIQ